MLVKGIRPLLPLWVKRQTFGLKDVVTGSEIGWLGGGGRGGGVGDRRRLGRGGAADVSGGVHRDSTLNGSVRFRNGWI